MTSKELFVFLLLLLTLSQWVIYFKLRAWRRSRHPEPKQGNPVDRVLWHTLSDTGTPWKAGDSWQRKGRRMTVALVRQGLGDMLNELNVNDYAPIYQLGYTVREEEEKAALSALQATIDRRDDTIETLRQKLRQAQEHQEQTSPIPHSTASKTEWEAFCEAWGRSEASIVDFKAVQRTTQPDKQIAPDSPSAPTQMTTAERDAEMLRLHETENVSYTELAKRFGFETRGGAQSACNRAKRRKEQQQASLLHLAPIEAAETPLLDGSNG